jgi:YHS domain-containing protein
MAWLFNLEPRRGDGMLKMLLAAMSVLVLAGCVENAPPQTTAAVTSGKAACHAECLVCKYNADLACVDVEVEKETPSYTYNGKTYYFCSKHCEKKFEADPAKYLGQK